MSKNGTLITVANSQDGATPRIVTETEHFPVKFGKGDLIYDAWGVQKVSYPRSLFHGMWTFNIPASMWFMYHNGTQVYTSTNITSVNGMAKLLTDATNTTVLLESRECPRYQPNRGHLFSTALFCQNKDADTIREWGVAIDGQNGAYFKLKSDGLLYACLLSGGVETLEELIDISELTGFSVEKNNIYDIQYQWRSAGNFKFFIGDPATGASKLVHTFSLLGTLTGASIQDPALPVYFHNESVTEHAAIFIGCADITSENGIEDTERYGAALAENVAVTGTDAPVIVVKQPLLINSKTNTRSITLARIALNCTKKSTFKVWMARDASLITGATFKTVNNGSFVESDSPDMDATAVRATAIDTSGMQFVTAVPVEAAKRELVDNPTPERIEFPVVRGDYVVVTITAASAVADCVVEWGEAV